MAGLLVGAVLNQRPELFAAAVPAVGVLDMLRYQTASLNARKWSSDYGLSEDPEEFAALRAYSPYHNLQPGLCYPAVLVQADANDDRVVAWHSYKYAAALQAAQAGGAGLPAPDPDPGGDAQRARRRRVPVEDGQRVRGPVGLRRGGTRR